MMDTTFILLKEKNGSNELKHILKPYVYYTKKYVRGNQTLVVNYTLDNFFVAYYQNGSNYQTITGYYIPEDVHTYADNLNMSDLPVSDEFINNVRVTIREDGNNEVDIIDPIAKRYYIEGSVNKSWLQIIGRDRLGIDVFETFENFDEERREVIKEQIQSGLNVAIENYNILGPDDGGVYTFKLPLLKETDWDLALSNISLISFLQGMNLGDRYYNGYAISAAFSDPYYTSEEEICHVDTSNVFHKIDCPHINGNLTNTYGKYMDIVRVKISDTNLLPRYSACYYCMVDGNYVSSAEDAEDRNRLKYESIAKLKWELVKRANLNFKI